MTRDPLHTGRRAGNARATLLAFLFSLGWVAGGSAHDGGFGHSRRAIFVAAEEQTLVIEYRVTQNRDEALIEMTHIDADHDGKISPVEKDRYFTARAKQLAENLKVHTAANERVPLKFIGYELKHPLVQVFRFRAETVAEVVFLDDHNFSHKPGQLRIHAGAGLTIAPAKPVDLNHAERLSLKITRVKGK